MQEKPLNSYFIDFDGTLSDTHFNPDTGLYDMGEPLPYMIDAVNNCATSHEIVIFTARPEEEWPAVREWLDTHGVIYQNVTNVKEPALRYVDDRAIRPDEFASMYGNRR